MVTSVTRATVAIPHNEMEYFTFGSGKTPLVMLPGLSVKSVIRSAESVASLYRMFAEDFTVYCFERSKFLSENYNIQQLSEDTAEAMRALDLNDACVFGVSQGGMMAQYLAIDHPQAVRKLVLGSTCARLNATANAVMERWVQCAERMDIDGFCDCFIDVLYGKAFAEKFGEFIRLAHRDITEEDFKRFVILGRACDTLNTYDRLESITCPTLVLGAKNDRVLTARGSVEIAEKLGCECYLYGEEYGHCVFDEAPDYKQRVYDFFIE